MNEGRPSLPTPTSCQPADSNGVTTGWGVQGWALGTSTPYLAIQWVLRFAKIRSFEGVCGGLQACIAGPPDNWRRGIGRTRQSWLRTVEAADLKPVNLRLATAKRLAQDRLAWGGISWQRRRRLRHDPEETERGVIHCPYSVAVPQTVSRNSVFLSAKSRSANGYTLIHLRRPLCSTCRNR